MRYCSIISCNEIHKAKGYCLNHYLTIYRKLVNSKGRTSYDHMIQRCYDKNSTQYKDWGGRGIGVCARWRKSFKNFIKDMGERPGNSYSIDRVDTNADYSPKNCRWATRTQQARNRRILKTNTSGVNGVSYHIGKSKWVAYISLNYKRINLGTYINLDDAINARKAAEIKHSFFDC